MRQINQIDSKEPDSTRRSVDGSLHIYGFPSLLLFSSSTMCSINNSTYKVAWAFNVIAHDHYSVFHVHLTLTCRCVPAVLIAEPVT